MARAVSLSDARPRRSCTGPAPPSALPACLQPPRLLTGSRFGRDRLAECTWSPADGLEAGAFLAPWLSSSGLAEHARLGVSVVLTLVDEGGWWRASTIACLSAAVPGEVGLYAASDMIGGESAGAMLDGQLLAEGKASSPEYKAAVKEAVASSDVHRYAYELRCNGRRSLYDGRECRAGGPRRANDARNTGRPANCALYRDGWVLVLRNRSVPALRASSSAAQRAGSELLWDYGDAYWVASSAALC